MFKRCPFEMGALAVADFASKYVRQRMPVILKGLCAHWPVIRNRTWTYEHLHEAFGRFEARVSFSPSNVFDIAIQDEVRFCPIITMPLAEFLDEHVLAKNAEHAYLSVGGSEAIRAVLNELIPADAAPDQPPFHNLAEMHYGEVQRLWISGRGVMSPGHRDPYHNFNICVAGTKRFLLVPPSEVRNVYDRMRIPQRFQRQGIDQYDLQPMEPVGRTVCGMSPVDFSNPCLLTFPRFADATVFEAVLQPGDILYIPFDWYHQVHSIADEREQSIAVNFWRNELLGLDVECDDAHVWVCQQAEGSVGML